MKHSIFNFIVEDYPRKNALSVYNTLFSSLVVVSRKDYADCLTRPTPFTDAFKNSGILVEDSVDEVQVYEVWLERLKASAADVLSPTLITTTNCNCRCTYCYESWMRDKKVVELNRKASEKICAWTEGKLRTKKYRMLDFCFHGGEPLLKIDEVEYMGKRLKKFCRKNKIDFSFGVVTNGTLLTKTNAKKLVNAGVTVVQVTLDGPKPIHDKRRCFKDARGTFDLIFNNLKQLSAKEFSLHLNVNIDRENAGQVEDLLDLLEKHGFQKKAAVLSLSNVVSSNGVYIDPKKDNAPEKLSALVTLAQKKGFHLVPFLKYQMVCPRIDAGGYVLMADGGLFKCISGVGIDAFKIGKVDDDPNLLFVKETQLDKTLLNKNCYACNLLPFCKNGCFFENYTRTGDIYKKVCRRDLFEPMIAGDIKRMVDKKLSSEKVERGGKQPLCAFH